jgi:hypothetical protein
MSWAKVAESIWALHFGCFPDRYKNDIVTAGTRDGRATFRNADQTTRQGLELSWQQTIWKELNIQSSLVISMLNLIVIQQK